MAGRKFIFAVGAFLLMFILLCFSIFSHRVSESIINQIIVAIMGIIIGYMGANVGTFFVSSRGKKNEPQ